jgi:hypothetical protein
MAGGSSGDWCMQENGSVLAKHGAKRPSLRAPRGRHRGLLELGGGLDPRPLEPQLCVHEHNLRAVEIPAVRNDPKRISKPRGGLWTSTYEPEYGSAWVRWCVAYRYTDPFESHWTVMLAPEAARVETIDSSAMLAELIERYPRTLRGRRGLDFELLSRDYDCLHLTPRGYLQTRSSRSGPSLRGWDCESTVWFRWIFREWRKVKAYFKDVDEYDNLWKRLSGWSEQDYTCHCMPANAASRQVYDTMLRGAC